MAYEIKVCAIEARPTVALRDKVARDQLATVLAQRVIEIEAFVTGNFGQSSGNPYARLHNYGAVERVNVDLEIGVPMAEAADMPGDAPFVAGELPGGEAAVLHYSGPYEEIGVAYEQLEAWVRENEREVAGAPWEFYLGDLESDQWQVELVWPLKSA